jgi:hypothetical protein
MVIIFLKNFQRIGRSHVETLSPNGKFTGNMRRRV